MWWSLRGATWAHGSQPGRWKQIEHSDGPSLRHPIRTEGSTVTPSVGNRSGRNVGFLIAVVLVLAAGCGEGKTPLSHDGFVAAASAVCNEENAELLEIEDPGDVDVPPTPAQMDDLADWLDRLVAISDDEERRLLALDVPDQDAAALRTAVALDAKPLAVYQKVAAELRAHDDAAADAAAEKFNTAPADAAYAALGLDSCGMGVWATNTEE